MKMTNYWMVQQLCPNSEKILKELYFHLPEEPCQCSDCQRFYKEHDRLIREFPTFKQQQELNWASIQSFRTLCNKVTNELQRELSERETNEDINLEEKNMKESMHVCKQQCSGKVFKKENWIYKNINKEARDV